MKHNPFLILFVATTLVSIFFPWVLVSAIGCLVVVVIQHSKTEKELTDAKQTYLLAVEKVEQAAKELKTTAETIEELHRQVENVKSSVAMSFRK